MKINIQSDTVLTKDKVVEGLAIVKSSGKEFKKTAKTKVRWGRMSLEPEEVKRMRPEAEEEEEQ